MGTSQRYDILFCIFAVASFNVFNFQKAPGANGFLRNFVNWKENFTPTNQVVRSLQQYQSSTAPCSTKVTNQSIVDVSGGTK